MKDQIKKGESRFMPFPLQLEVRQNENGENVIRGYALKFNSLSQEIWGMFREVIDPHALDNTDLSDVVSTLNHDVNNLLGRNSNNTLSLKRDEVGLFYEVIPPDTQVGRDAITLLKRGDISGSSFVFTVREDKWETLDDGTELRTVLDIEKIYELGPVVSPAYLNTEATVAQRSLEQYRQSKKPANVPVTIKHARAQAEALKLKHV